MPVVHHLQQIRPKCLLIYEKNWSIWKIHEKLAKTFDGDSIISFKRTINVKEVVSGNTIVYNKTKRTSKKI